MFKRIFKHAYSGADIFLIAANLLPVYGVWFLGWSAKEIFLVYCMETLIVGLFTLVKMGLTTSVKKWDWWEANGGRSKVHGVYHMLFFLFHYGFFVLLQMYFFSSAASFSTGSGFFLFQLFRHLNQNTWLLLGSFVIGYAYKDLLEFVVTGQYKTASINTLMFEPYIRIFIQQFTVIIGSLFLMAGAGKIFILVFSLIKIFFVFAMNHLAAKSKKNEEAAPRIPEATSSY